jgi:type VI secretion system secreted protein Hcp
MSQNIYLSVRGEKTGLFPGEERDGTIECVFYDQAASTPRDNAHGVASSGFKHNPVMMRKQIDSTTPYFASAFACNEVLESVTFRFVPSTHQAGTRLAIFCVTLVNATIASYRHVYADTPTARYVGWQVLEEAGFYYQRIEWGFTDNTAAASLEWPLGI